MANGRRGQINWGTLSSILFVLAIIIGIIVYALVIDHEIILAFLLVFGGISAFALFMGAIIQITVAWDTKQWPFHWRK